MRLETRDIYLIPAVFLTTMLIAQKMVYSGFGVLGYALAVLPVVVLYYISYVSTEWRRLALQYAIGGSIFFLLFLWKVSLYWNYELR